jgi:hypothetical protein
MFLFWGVLPGHKQLFFLWYPNMFVTDVSEGRRVRGFNQKNIDRMLRFRSGAALRSVRCANDA